MEPDLRQRGLDLGLGIGVCWPLPQGRKGAVENLVGWVKGSFFKQRRFVDEEDLRHQLGSGTPRSTSSVLAGDRRACRQAARLRNSRDFGRSRSRPRRWHCAARGRRAHRHGAGRTLATRCRRKRSAQSGHSICIASDPHRRRALRRPARAASGPARYHADRASRAESGRHSRANAASVI